MYIEKHKIIKSTKELADKYIITQQHTDNFLIISETQTNGLGRKGQLWESPLGGLWFSLGMKHISKHICFPLFIGVCVLKALESLKNEQDQCFFKIKWPNDVYLDDNKICGLLCASHRKLGMTNIGIGVNTNNSPAFSISIKDKLQKDINNEEFLHKILDLFFRDYLQFEAEGFQFLSAYYAEHDYLLNKRIEIETGDTRYAGNYLGLNEEGALMLQLENDIVNTFLSGTIYFL